MNALRRWALLQIVNHSQIHFKVFKRARFVPLTILAEHYMQFATICPRDLYERR